jgi:hypothetical protein
VWHQIEVPKDQAFDIAIRGYRDDGAVADGKQHFEWHHDNPHNNKIDVHVVHKPHVTGDFTFKFVISPAIGQATGS